MYYTYAIYDKHDKDTLYIGKGCGDRLHGPKNALFEKYVTLLGEDNIVRERVQSHTDERAAFTHEAKLIRKFRPQFNRNDGLTPGKWVEGEAVKLQDLLTAEKQFARGAESATPPALADAMVKQIKPGNKVLLIGDRWAEIYLAILLNGVPCSVTVIIDPQGTNGSSGATASEFTRMSEEFNVSEAQLLRVQDFLAWETTQRYDCVIMNPPFSESADGDNWRSKLWLKFVVRSLTLLTTTGQLFAIIPAANALRYEHVVLQQAKIGTIAVCVVQLQQAAKQLPRQTLQGLVAQDIGIPRWQLGLGNLHADQPACAFEYHSGMFLHGRLADIVKGKTSIVVYGDNVQTLIRLMLASGQSKLADTLNGHYAKFTSEQLRRFIAELMEGA